MSSLISIVVRTKNEERWITQCLNAVFSQDYKDFEVIIVDNESNDSTIKKQASFTYKRYSPVRTTFQVKRLILV